MVHYQLYFLNEDGRIRRRLDLECRDDEHALEVASEHRHRFGLELWQGKRLVDRLLPKEN